MNLGEIVVKRNVNLDIIRIIAVFMVVSVHVGQYAGFDFSVGAKGV
jgi:surface polysaccharide O-acyltransferase-like enzyme